MNLIRTIIFFCLVTPCLLSAQTIAEKKATLLEGGSDLSIATEQVLAEINRDTTEFYSHLRELYKRARELYGEETHEEEFHTLLTTIQEHRLRIDTLQEAWRDRVGKENRTAYGLWQQPETTLEQLIMDYGSTDYVYLIPPEVGELRISIDSQLPIPRSSWNEMLEIILHQNGVGVRQLTPYLREVFLLEEYPGKIVAITNRSEELLTYPSDTRAIFVLSPEVTEYRRAKQFLQRFMNNKTMDLQEVGRELLLVGLVSDILDILKLYAFVDLHKGAQEYRVISLQKVPTEEMIQILRATFEISDEEGAASNPKSLRVVEMSASHQALFMIGSREEVRKAEEVIRQVEKQLAGGREKTLFRYQVRHSDPEMLADVLSKVYTLMKSMGCAEYTWNGDEASISQTNLNIVPPDEREYALPEQLYAESFYQSGSDIVNPAPIEPGRPKKVEDPNRDRNNFIVDLKTGSIVMVVEADLLPHIKELLAKLDVPKLMVQIETMLFEKKLRHRDDFGLNLLRIGSGACHTNAQGVRWNDTFYDIGHRGIFQYFLSRMHDACGIPAFDLSYKFLLSQDDVTVNAAPSVVAINNTPATIAIEDEISINTGIFEVETARGVTLKDAFTRAQYGITIVITPTIHIAQEGEEGGDYVTLETDITFDTIQRGSNPERPDVTRRHVTNYVSIPDGQSVIIGGLRRKRSDDLKETIPFLGELPGIGKLFGNSSSEDESTDMFFFITPKIIRDPIEDFRRLRREELCLRPGDIPSFLANLNEARKLEKEQLFENTLTALFGRGCDRYYVPEGEYDGRS